MVSKFLEKRVDLFTEEDKTEFTNKVKLEYYLLESEEMQRGEFAGKEVYGIEIVKNDGSGYCESETVKNLFQCRESTRLLLKKLAANRVTPVSLYEVLDDIIGA